MVEYKQKTDSTYDCIITIVKPDELAEVPIMGFLCAYKKAIEVMIENCPNNSLSILDNKLLNLIGDTYLQRYNGIMTINVKNKNFHIDIIIAILNGLKYLPEDLKNYAVDFLTLLPPIELNY